MIYFEMSPILGALPKEKRMYTLCCSKRCESDLHIVLSELWYLESPLISPNQLFEDNIATKKRFENLKRLESEKKKNLETYDKSLQYVKTIKEERFN